MSTEVNLLAQEIGRFCDSHGTELCSDYEDSASLLLQWLSYLRSSQQTGSADLLLDGLHASLVETCSYVCVGLVRPGVFSIRAQVDIALAWLFFKDHPVEWERVETVGEGYRLPADALKFLKVHYLGFEMRMDLLQKVKTRTVDNPYRLLSAHVHGQNSSTLPPLGKPIELVQPVEKCKECLTLQHEISEYLSDIFLACFARDWPDLPDVVCAHARARLNATQLEKVCK